MYLVREMGRESNEMIRKTFKVSRPLRLKDDSAKHCMSWRYISS